LELTGTSSAAELTLSSEDSIQLADTATLTVHGNTDLTADEITFEVNSEVAVSRFILRGMSGFMKPRR
jgi:hypothetical protein